MKTQDGFGLECLKMGEGIHWCVVSLGSVLVYLGNYVLCVVLYCVYLVCTLFASFFFEGSQLIEKKMFKVVRVNSWYKLKKKKEEMRQDCIDQPKIITKGIIIK